MHFLKSISSCHTESISIILVRFHTCSVGHALALCWYDYNPGSHLNFIERPFWTHNRSSRNWKRNVTGSTGPLQPSVEIQSPSARVPVNVMEGNGTCQQQLVGRSVRPQRDVGQNGGRRKQRHDLDPVHHGCARPAHGRTRLPGPSGLRSTGCLRCVCTWPTNIPQLKSSSQPTSILNELMQSSTIIQRYT